MNIKRKSSLMLLLIFVMSMLQSFSINSIAASSPTVYSPAIEATAGQELRVPVYIKNNTGIVGWGLTLMYDKNVLTAKSIEYGSSYNTVITGGMQNNIGGDAVPGSVNIFWAGSSDESYNGVMFYAVFEVNASAVGETVIDIAYSQADTFNENFEDVVLTCESIKINVKNNQLQNFVRFSSRTSVNELLAGESFSIFISVDEINGMSSADLSVEYDVIYEYDSLNFKIVSVKALSGAKTTYSDHNGNLDISLSNLSSDLVGKDVVEIKITSKEKAAAGEHIFAFTSADTAVVGCECKVNIKPTGDSETALIYSQQVSGKYNETVTVPVCIKYNKGLMGFRLKFDYDTSALEFDSATKSSFLNGNFDYNVNSETGHIEVLWNNSEEITDNGEMLFLLFRVKTETRCTSFISVDYSQPDTFNEQYEDMLLDCQKIEISLNPECKHAYSSTVTTAATCTADGVRTYTCSNCNDTYTEAITKLGHDYKSVVTAPTCEAGGYTTHTCSRCSHSYTDNETAKLGHSYTSKVTKAATCTEDGVRTYTCSNCNDTYTEVITKLGHDYKSVVTAPTCEAGGYTTHTCSRCNDSYTDSETVKLGHSYTSKVTKAATCTEDGVRTYTCSNCGDSYTEAITKLGHDYKSVVTAPTCEAGGYTTHTCSRCSHSYTDSETPKLGHSYTSKVTKAATCTADGVRTYTCSNCSDSYTEVITKLGHDYKSVVTAPTCETGGYTTHTCSRCSNSYKDNETAKLGHSYTSKVTKAATCTADGVRTYTCSNCNDTYTEVITKLGHDYKSVVTAPNCEAGGYTTHTCSRCSDTYTDSETAKLGHSYTSKVTKAATCTADGVRTYTCSNCNDTYTEAITKLGHDYKAVVTAPTCEAGGYTTHTCSRCSHSYTDNETPKLGHNYTSEVTKAATCTADGVRTYTCSNCNDSYTEVIAKLGHDYKSVVTAPTCEADGYTTHTCSRCSDTYKDSETPKLGHNYTSEVTKAATCTADGMRTYTCSNCNDSYTEVIPKLSHDYKSVVTAPTCEAGGYTTHTCSRCSHSYTDSETAKLGHSYTSTVTKAATCTEDGVRTYTCSNCNDTYTEVITKLGHDYKSVVTAPTCEAGGYTTHTCSRCSHSYTDSETSALGHNYDEVQVFATCTEMGYNVHVCSNCNNSYKDKYVNPLGHDYTTIVTNATCLTGGYTEHTCQRCDDCYTDCHTDALSHDFGEWTTVIQPQADKRGLAERGCSRCDETEQKVLYYATPEISFSAAEKTIRYGETLVIAPVVANIPEGLTVEWYLGGNGVYSEYNEEENTWYLRAIDSGSVDVLARVIDENGEPVLDENGDEITAEMKVTVKSNFFLKIISFFKNLFRMNRFVY